MALGFVTILNLRDGGSIDLRFPEKIRNDDAINYEEQDVAGGVKPLDYANRNPQEIVLDNLVLDNTLTNKSVEPELQKLRKLCETDPKHGDPPPLQLVTAGWDARVRLTNLSVERERHTSSGECLRARLQITFKELRKERQSLTFTAQPGGKPETRSKTRKRNPKRREKRGRTR